MLEHVDSTLVKVNLAPRKGPHLTQMPKRIAEAYFWERGLYKFAGIEPVVSPVLRPLRAKYGLGRLSLTGLGIAAAIPAGYFAFSKAIIPLVGMGCEWVRLLGKAL